MFGKYDLLGLIGRGGMAEVFAAETATLDGFTKQLAIKRIRPELTDDERFVSMFLDEARICFSLTHPNLVQVFDFGQAEGCYFLAMEHVQGVDLSGLLHLPIVRARGLEPGLAVLIMQEVLKGLDCAHNLVGRDGQQLALVHRDISPHNILVAFNGAVKVTDFGIAKARCRATETQPGVVLGKFSYMSPEQACGEPLDSRTDVFSCGVVLWELLVGRTRQSICSDTGDLLTVIREGQLPAPWKLNRALHKRLGKIVMQAVEPDREGRFPSARQFGQALHAYLVSSHPDISSYSLQAFLEQHRETLCASGAVVPTARPDAHRDSGATGPSGRPSETPCGAAASAGQAAPGVTISLGSQASADQTAVSWASDQQKLLQEFRCTPSLWLLLKLGDSCRERNMLGAALTVYRAAAVKFAQHGLLAECLLCAHRMFSVSDAAHLKQEVSAFIRLPGLGDSELDPFLFRREGSVERLLRGLLNEAGATVAAPSRRTPLLSYLAGHAFSELAARAPVRRFGGTEAIIREGDVGRTMFLVARGRVVVHVVGPEGERVYLASLTAGEFFGENGFFTGAQRSATVEAMGTVEVVEMDPALYDEVAGRNEQARNILLRFYKERIVEAVLAKSPVFGMLTREDRRTLTGKFSLVEFPADAQVLREGERSDQIYLVKQGKAEVSTQKDGQRVVLSVIGPNTVFGEVAAVRGIPRTATVTALGDIEALVLECGHLRELVDAKPELRKRLQGMIMERARDNIDALVDIRPRLRG